jgi:DNA-binding beta-propeller fold protein YncE
MAKRLLVVIASTPTALIACHTSEDLPTDPPTQVQKVSSGGFQSPTDAVASPDGRTFYFAAWDMDKQPTLYQVAADANSAPTVLAAGDPLEAPMGLVLSCDGKTLYAADMGVEAGQIVTVSTSGGPATILGTSGISRPSGLAMGPDCKSLFATGRLDDNTPALFEVPLAGGAARAIYHGDPLVEPTGMFVDSQGVAWVMDHHAVGKDGEGVLYAISSDGSKATEVMSNLRMGTPGGVSLTAGGGTAVMPTRDADGAAQLTSVDIATGEVKQLPTPDIAYGAGLRTARNAGVFVVVDAENDSIYSAH